MDKVTENVLVLNNKEGTYMFVQVMESELVAFTSL